MINLLSKHRAITIVSRRAAGERWPLALLPALSGTVALAVYLATLAPDLSWQHYGSDGGELITAAATLGIPHPPGYPTYVLLGKLLSLLPVGTVAWRFNLFSAVCMALATAVLAATIAGLQQRPKQPLSGNLGISTTAAALAFAFFPLVWSQAIITEVYALNLLFLAGFLWATMVRQSTALAGLCLGLGITGHLTSLFLLPFAFLITPRASWRVLLGWLLIGLLPLATLPVLARGNSPVMWGEPVDLQGWWWLVSGRLYHANLRFPPEMAHTSFVLRSLLQPMLWPVLVLLLAGSLTRAVYARKQRSAGAGIAVQSQAFTGRSTTRRPLPDLDHSRRLLAVLAATIIFYVGYAVLYQTADAPVLLLPAVLLSAILFAPLLDYAGPAAILLPVVLVALNFQPLNAAGDRSVRPLAEQLLAGAPANAILLTPGDRSIFTLWYFQAVEAQRPDLILVDSNLFAFSWYRQRLERQFPELRALQADDLPAFQQANQGQRPFCRAGLLANESGPAAVHCERNRPAGNGG
jgi:hypothetical protein